MIDNLSQEVIKRILANVGVVPGMLGKALTNSNFLLEKRIGIDYDGEIKYHDVYAGKLSESSFDMRSLLVDLSLEDEPEFLLLFRVNAMPIHAVRYTYNAPEVVMHNAYFRAQHPEKKHWYNISVELMAKILAEFERFTSYGLLWNECLEVSDLYEAATQLINGVEEDGN